MNNRRKLNNINVLAKSIKKCSGFCVPLILYIIFSVLGIIGIMLRPVQTKIKENPVNKITVVTIQLLINFGIGGLVYWLCTKCNYTAAWLVFLLPFIFGIIFIAIVFIGFGALINKEEQDKIREERIKKKIKKRNKNKH